MPHNPSTREVEIGGTKAQGHPQLHSKFKASLGYKRYCIQKEFISSLRLLEVGIDLGDCFPVLLVPRSLGCEVSLSNLKV